MTGRGGASAVAGEDLFVVDNVPFAWLFPQAAAVVHHGGSGTTALGLRAGRPTIIVPSMMDQPFWGQRVADLGAGSRPIPRKQLSVERLAADIEQAVSDGEMQRRAEALGEKNPGRGWGGHGGGDHQRVGAWLTRRQEPGLAAGLDYEAYLPLVIRGGQ